jgi:hypothetical protein
VSRFIGFEEPEALVANVAWGRPVAGNERFPGVKATPTADLLLARGGIFVPRFIGFEEPEVLAAETGRQQSATSYEISIRYFILSLGLHLVLILSLLAESTVPGAVVGSVHVQLVFESPLDAELPTQVSQPPPGFVSEEGDGLMEGEPRRANSDLPPVGARPPAEVSPTKRIAPKTPAAKPMPSARQPGSEASFLSEAERSEYIAYLIKHIGVLPSAVVGNRRGETKLGLFVQNDGTITQVVITGSSGYPDIDLTIEKMVAQVRQLPPLGQEFGNRGMNFELTLGFKFGPPLGP